MNSIYVDIGRRIRELRISSKLTQNELSNKAHISLSFLGHIERGSRKLSVETLYAIATALNCSSDRLMGLPRPDKTRLESARELLRLALEMSEENLLPG